MALDQKYLNKKLREIEGEVAIASAVAVFIGVMYGKSTGGVIKARDEATHNIHKVVRQILKKAKVKL